MSYTLEFSEIALSDIKKHKKSGDKVVLKKIEKLLNELMEHPTMGTGQPEQLKHNLTGLYSRRIVNIQEKEPVLFTKSVPAKIRKS